MSFHFNDDSRLPKYIEEEMVTRIIARLDQVFQERNQQWKHHTPLDGNEANEIIKEFIVEIVKKEFISNGAVIEDGIGDTRIMFITESKDMAQYYMIVQREYYPDDYMDETFYQFGNNWGVMVYTKIEHPDDVPSSEQEKKSSLIFFKPSEEYFAEGLNFQEAVLCACILRDERDAISDVEDFLRGL